MLALVTGGTGFIGSHVVERLLLAGHRVRVLVRNERTGQWLKQQGAELCPGDVTDVKTLRQTAVGVDMLFHLAAYVSEWGPWSKFHAITVEGTQNMLAAAAAARVPRFLHMSTATVYDDRFARRARVITEDAPLGSCGDRAYGNYSRAKVLAEQAVWHAHATGATKATIVRPAWVYGPRDYTILPRLVDHLKGPLACWIGSRNPVVDPIYVTDVAECIYLAALSERAVGRAYNIAPQVEVRLRRFVAALCRQLEVAEPQWSLPYSVAFAATMLSESWARMTASREQPTLTMTGLASFTVDQHFDPTNAVSDLGWSPRVSLNEGAERTAAWYSSLN